MTQPRSIAIIIPVHNRRAVTIACLQQLKVNGDLSAYQVIVVDDGSTDGTADAIRTTYPSVKILSGDGNLWWTGAIALGMRHAYDQGADYVIWLNDDARPQQGAIATLIHTCHGQTLVGGQCYSPEGTPTYGGQKRQGWLKLRPVYAPPNEQILADALDGNFVCLPRSVIDTIGYPPADQLPHYGGDTIYTWKAKQAGFPLLVVGQAIAQCSANPGDSSWMLSSVPISTRWQNLRSPKSMYYVSGYWNFCLAFWGISGILVFIQPYLRLLMIGVLRWIVPRPVLKWLKSPRSSIPKSAS